MNSHARFNYDSGTGVPVLPVGSGKVSNRRDHSAWLVLGVALAGAAALAAFKMRKQPEPMPIVDILPAPAPQMKAFKIDGLHYVDTAQLNLDNEGWLWASGDFTIQPTKSNFDTVVLHKHWNDQGTFFPGCEDSHR